MERRSSLKPREGPASAVLAAFDVVDGDRETLVGGGELSVRVGNVVFKQVDDVAVAVWVQSVLAELQPRTWRAPAPVPTLEGAWSVDGWTATEFIEGLQPLVDEPGAVVAIGRDIGTELTAHAAGDVEPLRQRTDRWAVADRVAWDELRPTEIELSAQVMKLLERLFAHCTAASEPETIVHGDLANNVFVDRARRPVVLDMAPYRRPQRYGDAIVLVDHLLWSSQSTALRNLTDDDALARALVFRLVSDRLGVADGDDRGVHEFGRAADRLGL